MKDNELTRKNSESAETKIIDLSDEQLKAMNAGRDLTSDDSLIGTSADQGGALAIVIC